MTWHTHHVKALDYQERGQPLRARCHANLALRAASTPPERAETTLVLEWISRQLAGESTVEIPPGLAARAKCLYGLGECMAGNHESAASALAEAADELDPRWRANALVGLGVSAGYLTRPADAYAALAEARQLYRAINEPERAATCVHNAGFVAFRAGAFDLALRLYAEAAIDEHARPEVLVDKAHALARAGRPAEAGRALTRAAKLLGAAGRGPAFAEATLAHARCALANDDHDAAARTATSAAHLFERQGSPNWLAQARAVALLAHIRATPTTHSPHEPAHSPRESADRSREPLHPVRGINAARESARSPRGCAESPHEPVHPSRGINAARESASSPREAAQPSRGLVHLPRESVDAAGEPVHVAWAGIGAVAPGQVDSSLQRLRLPADALRMAGVDSVGDLLSLAEQCERSGSVADAAELRLAVDRPDLVTAQRTGVTPDLRAVGWLAAARTAATRRGVLAACRAGLRHNPAEARLASTGLHAALASGRASSVFDWIERSHLGVASRAQVASALDGRAMAAFAFHDERLVVAVLSAGRCRVLDLCPTDAFEHATRALRVASALAAATGDHSAARQARSAVDGLVAPVARLIGDRELVAVCAPVDVAWSEVFRGRPVVVAPSASVWMECRSAPPVIGDRVWVAGPDLPYAAKETADLHRVHGGTLLAGSAATADAVRSAATGAGMIHIAAHGHGSLADPAASALALADGRHPIRALWCEVEPRPSRLPDDIDLRDLIAHLAADADAADARPRLVVLSACESVRPESLLGHGTATVIASMLPVPDEGAASLMVEFHERLASGTPAATALAEAQEVHGHFGFCCFGAG